MRGRAVHYSSAELLFIQALHELPRAIICGAFAVEFNRHDVSEEAIRALCVRHGWGTRSRWSPEESAYVREAYPNTPTASIAHTLGRPLSSVYQHAAALGLKKSDAYLASDAACRLRRGDNVGAAYRFTRGHVPANKGLRGRKGWAPGRMAATQFRPGQKGTRWMPIGATRLIGGYEYTKVSDVPKVPHTVNWKPTHVLRWTAVHGPVPEGHALKCVDGNRLNVAPDNWMLVPRGVLPLLNGGRHRTRLAYDEAPPELKPLVLKTAQLRHALHQKRKRDAA